MIYSKYDQLIISISECILEMDKNDPFFASKEIRALFVSAVENTKHSRSKIKKEIAIRDWIDWVVDFEPEEADRLNVEFRAVKDYYEKDKK